MSDFQLICIGIAAAVVSLIPSAFVFKVIFFSGMKHSFEDDMDSGEIEMMKEQLRKFSPPYNGE